MGRFTMRALALALLSSVAALDAQAAPITSRGQADSPPTPTQNSVDKARTQEYQVYQERYQVCLKLREIALQTKDETLYQKAEKLEAMAWDAYELRLTKLSTVAVAEAPAAETVSNRRPSKPKQPLRAPNGRIIREDNP